MQNPVKKNTKKSPIVVARSILKSAKRDYDTYGSIYSKRKYTQPQLFSILVLKAFFNTDYRGIVNILQEFDGLRDALELKSIPHFSTLAHAEKRFLERKLMKYSQKLFLEE